VSPPASLCVFCGSRFGADPTYRGIATLLGRTLAEKNVTLVYGGGGVGLMGLTANAALAAGGRVVGIIPEFLFKREAGHPDLSDLVVVKSMHERKLEMFERSEGFVVLPGGLGTLEEFFEVLSWRTLGLHDKPIVIIDHGGYWQPLHDLLNRVIEGEFADRRYLDHVAFVTRVEDVLPAIEAMPRTPMAEKKLDKL
jgi:uncharacterized protein (TIGR00730 family)